MPLVPRCYELHGSEVVFGALVIPGCDISGLFDLVEDSFNEVPQRKKPWLAVFRVTFEAGDSSIYLKQSDDAVVLINARPPISVGLENPLPAVPHPICHTSIQGGIPMPSSELLPYILPATKINEN